MGSGAGSSPPLPPELSTVLSPGLAVGQTQGSLEELSLVSIHSRPTSCPLSVSSVTHGLSLAGLG